MLSTLFPRALAISSVALTIEGLRELRRVGQEAGGLHYGLTFVWARLYFCSELALMSNYLHHIWVSGESLYGVLSPGAGSLRVLKQEVAPFCDLVSCDLRHEVQVHDGGDSLLFEPLSHARTVPKAVELIPCAEGLALRAADNQHGLLLSQEVPRSPSL